MKRAPNYAYSAASYHRRPPVSVFLTGGPPRGALSPDPRRPITAGTAPVDSGGARCLAACIRNASTGPRRRGLPGACVHPLLPSTSGSPHLSLLSLTHASQTTWALSANLQH